MTADEKLDVLLSEMQGMKADMQLMNQRMDLLGHRMDGLELQVRSTE